MDQVVGSLSELGQAKSDKECLGHTNREFRQVLMQPVCPTGELKYVQIVTCAAHHATYIVGADFAAKKTSCIMVGAAGIILDGEEKLKLELLLLTCLRGRE